MKVVHINWCLRYGGIETMLINIANTQVEEGAEVHVCIIDEQYDKDLLHAFDGRVKIHFLHRACQSRCIGFLIRLNYLLMRLQPNAIHLHDSRIYTFLWSRELCRVASVTLHDLPTGTIRRGGPIAWLFPFIFKSGNVYYIDKIPRVFAISDAVKKALQKEYQIASTVICNGISTRKFKRRTEHQPSNPFRIVMVSRLEHEKKGQDLLIKAAAQLKGIVHIDFIGDGTSRAFLEKQAQQYQIEGEVSFLGMQAQSYLTQHLCDYDLLVQPSRWEGFGLTVAEAMASQLPVLVSAGQGPAEVTCGNRFGWTFENGNTNSLTQQILYILEHYDTVIAKATEALHYVQENYDVSVTAKNYLNLYSTNPFKEP